MPVSPVSSARPIQVKGEGASNATFERELPGVGKDELYALLVARFEELRVKIGGKGKLTLDPANHAARLEGLGAKFMIQASDDGAVGEAITGRVVVTVKRYPIIGEAKVNAAVRRVLEEMPAYVTNARLAKWGPPGPD